MAEKELNGLMSYYQKKMAKIIIIESNGKSVGYCFKCPACGFLHKFCTADAHTEGWPVWTLTGTPEKPTIRDSILVKEDFGENHESRQCHSFVTDGQISFCGDCTHSMAGQTVPLPEI